MFGWMPGLRAISSCQREWLAKDVVVGVVLSTLLVPQGMTSKQCRVSKARARDR